MAQLNSYENSEGAVVPVPLRPVDKYSPNGLSRITPLASREYAKLAYKAWVDSGTPAPWDGIYTDDDGPQNLNYL